MDVSVGNTCDLDSEGGVAGYPHPYGWGLRMRLGIRSSSRRTVTSLALMRPGPFGISSLSNAIGVRRQRIVGWSKGLTTLHRIARSQQCCGLQRPCCGPVLSRRSGCLERGKDRGPVVWRCAEPLLYLQAEYGPRMRGGLDFRARTAKPDLSADRDRQQEGRRAPTLRW